MDEYTSFTVTYQNAVTKERVKAAVSARTIQEATLLARAQGNPSTQGREFTASDYWEVLSVEPTDFSSPLVSEKACAIVHRHIAKAREQAERSLHDKEKWVIHPAAKARLDGLKELAKDLGVDIPETEEQS